MKKLFEEDENQDSGLEKAQILVKVIPFVLIIVILGITLVVNGVRKKDDDGTAKLQDNIKEYADENHSVETSSQSLLAKATPESEEESGERKEPEQTAAPSPSPAPVPTPTPYKEVMEAGKTDYSKVAFDKEEQLKEMMSYWADNNQKALDDLANLDRFIAMSWKLKGTEDFYYYGGRNGDGLPEGKGIAVYADNQYYYGDWKGGVRSGTGTWIHYHIHFEDNKTDLYTYHQYTGGWAEDLPAGEGSEHYDYNVSLFKERVGYDTNRIGSYAKGLVDGEFYITSLFSDESIKEWNAKGEKGSWIYLTELKDQKGNRPVYVEIQNPENYTWMHPAQNVNIGVPCLISKHKN